MDLSYHWVTAMQSIEGNLILFQQNSNYSYFQLSCIVTPASWLWIEEVNNYILWKENKLFVGFYLSNIFEMLLGVGIIIYLT